MLQSMTGFGKATATFSGKKVTVEIKSVNSKGVDLYVKIPNSYRSLELSIRKIIGEGLSRGKVECFISEEIVGEHLNVNINQKIVKAYYKEVKEVAENLNASLDGLMATVLRFPEVLQTNEEDVSEEEWQQVRILIDEAIVKVNNYRDAEGKAILSDFIKSVDNIENCLHQVSHYEEKRIESVKERLYKNLDAVTQVVDENRFEQELIFYLEKMDVNEEKQRLQHHLDYFRNTLKNGKNQGKKLNFIAQEMGREINTLGSKSYNSEMQRLVVEMKDNLEKIKEQVLNTL